MIHGEERRIEKYPSRVTEIPAVLIHNKAIWWGLSPRTRGARMGDAIWLRNGISDSAWKINFLEVAFVKYFHPIILKARNLRILH